ncbi:MAG: DNA polymerase I, partial [Burkholderiaceae bacterium]|nr:DNA polymerase I [Burkholderiaceae bacterium]
GRSGISYEDLCGKGVHQIPFAQVPVDKAAAYACEDADQTLDVHQALWPLLAAHDKLRAIYALEIASSEVLYHVERHGVLIDAPLLAAQSQQLGERIVELEQEAYALAGQPFNLNSPKQLGEIFFDKLDMPVVKKTATGARSTDEEVLEKLALDYPLPAKILEHRSLSKLKGTYTDKLAGMAHPRTGRVHTHYAQAVAVTGRLSSNEPNLQNIPIRTPEGRRVREAFVAAPGCVIASADYSQIELRIMAHLSGDHALLHAFQHGLDVHRATAAEVFGVSVHEVTPEQRRYAKVINFGLIYGMSSFGLARNLGIDQTAAKNYIQRYFERYPGVKQYMDDTKAQAKAMGYVETVFGRRLMLPEINSPNGPRRAAAERAAINAPMQGTAADLIKMAMVAVQKVLEAEKPSIKMIMQVHDELVFELPESEVDWLRQQVPRLMAGVASLRVPLLAEVGVGPNWEQAH